MTTSHLRKPSATMLAKARAFISAYDHESIRDLPPEERLEKAVQRSGFPGEKPSDRRGALHMIEVYLASNGGRATAPDIARYHGLTATATKSMLGILMKKKLVRRSDGTLDTFEILRN